MNPERNQGRLESTRFWHAGALRVDPVSGQAWLEDRPLPIRGRAVDVLMLLMSAAGRTVSKDEIIDKVWGGAAVSESVITTAIRELRVVLADDAKNPCFIRTVHRRGYCFLLQVSHQPAVAQPGSTRAVERRRGTLAAALLGVLALAALGVALIGVPQSGDRAALDAAGPGLSEPAIPAIIIEPVVGTESAPQLAGLDQGIRAAVSRLGMSDRLAVVARGADVAGDIYRLTGAVRADPNNPKLILTLDSETRGREVWSASFDLGDKGGIVTRDEIAPLTALVVAAAVRSETAARMAALGTGSLDAYVTYLEGEELFLRAHDSYPVDTALLVEANRWFDKAIAFDPTLLPARTKRMDLFFHLLADNAIAPTPSMTTAEAAALQAELESQAREATAHTKEPPLVAAILATAHLFSDDWAGLDQRLKAALSLNHSADDLLWFAKPAIQFLPKQAADFASKNAGEQQRNPLYYDIGGKARHSLGDYDGTARWYAEGVRRFPANDYLRSSLVMAHLLDGRPREAAGVARAMRDGFPAAAARLFLEHSEGRRSSAEMPGQIEAMLPDLNLEQRLVLLSLADAMLEGGYRAPASRIAAQIDARPAGPMALLIALAHCLCKPAFDFSTTPNLARRLLEAEFIRSDLVNSTTDPDDPPRYPIR